MSNEKFVTIRPFTVDPVNTILCDADGNLFPSEEPAFAASVEVTNQFLTRFGVPARYTAEELRKQTTGKNFRATALDLAVAGGVPIEEPVASCHPQAVLATNDDVLADRALTLDQLEAWVRRERDHVTAHLATALRPDSSVLEPLKALYGRYGLAAVSSSALIRLDACFAATGLDAFIPCELRFSAEDSFPVPTSKPDPAVYTLTGEALGVTTTQGLAIEDSVPGILSAVAAGFITIGNLTFVPANERCSRATELARSGAHAISNSWAAIADFLLRRP
ncbi:HAD family phosphatase [Mycobacterium sp. 852002-40037_SCH5390672]|uniref:HAD family hydrolase n=1 Tax=Mycobacterium sp. 852002-40037_SCH5390672 TaxID=1834089 RepID=UPI000804C6C6|nr:HAD family phosphatase [Mycobacterium sp. 852002-40037_SCH5390672]OBC02596.1 haloacid dehalogenase [Mycobacterium sp. 852002-40037_SCH5390672]